MWEKSLMAQMSWEWSAACAVNVREVTLPSAFPVQVRRPPWVALLLLWSPSSPSGREAGRTRVRAVEGEGPRAELLRREAEGPLLPLPRVYTRALLAAATAGPGSRPFPVTDTLITIGQLSEPWWPCVRTLEAAFPFPPLVRPGHLQPCCLGRALGQRLSRASSP